MIYEKILAAKRSGGDMKVHIVRYPDVNDAI